MGIGTKLINIVRPAPRPAHFYDYQRTDRQTIRVENICFPIAKSPSLIHPAWSASLEHGLVPEKLAVSGQIFLANGAFSPEKVEGALPLPKDSILGLVVKYDEQGNRLKSPAGDETPTVVSLGKYRVLDQSDHVLRTIEIVPSTNPKKLKVIEARMETTGLHDDQSKFIYNITKAGADRINRFIADLNWVQRVSVNADREVVIDYTKPDRSQDKLVMAGRYFVDNFDRPFLANAKAGMAGFQDFYQSDIKAAETNRFQPVIDRYPHRNGTPRLILHKTTCYEIDWPGPELEGRVKIFPATAAAAAKIKGEWLPLSLNERLTKQDARLISLPHSRVQAGRKQSAIGSQDRTGNMGEMSGDYPRDPNFYGFRIFKQVHHILKYGDNVAINKGKSVSDEGGIESGRTHTMPHILLYDKLLADMIETNNPYVRKLSNYGHHSGGPGVSEDTQMELVTRLLGIRMWVVNELLDRMPAEKRWGKYNIQNAVRYIFSESLFALPMRLVVRDIIGGRFFGQQPVYMKWGQMAQITAGRTWYKWVLAKMVEVAAVPIFLGTLGHVLFFPVDLKYFLIALLARTIIATANYATQLASLGYDGWKGLKCGLWKNPAYERTFAVGYLRSALRQWLDKNQWATFALTVGGAETPPPARNKWFVGVTMVIEGMSLTASGAFLLLGGLAQLAWPLGLAIGVNIFFTFYDLGLNFTALKLMKRESQPDAKQVTFEEFKNTRPDDYQALRLAADGTWQNGLDSLRGETLDYTALFSQLGVLHQLLKDLNAFDKKGRVSIGWDNRYRDIANQVLDLSTGIEMMVCLTALKELETDINNPAARTALTKLLKETKEFVIIDTAIKAVRMHGWKLEL